MSRIFYRDWLHQLPLILAGPILRHTRSESVTVWIALKESSQVKLNVYTTKDNGIAIDRLVMTAESNTVAIGEHLHLLAITASGKNLRSGQIYAYDLSFTKSDGTIQNLNDALTSSILPQVPISYFHHHLPTFSLPPEEIDRLKIVQGSCRKPHGKDRDALAILDSLIENAAEFPLDRPHQLFLTGDQIYGDDVADPLLQSATELGDTLLGWEEQLPLEYSSDLSIVSTTAKQIQPGKRSKLTEVRAGLTAGLNGKTAHAKSHLLSFGEYCAVYLLSLSQVFWLEFVPEPTEMNLTKKEAKSWRKEVDELKIFVSTLWKVRRSLANIPTYTIFDDHDVSDDWNLNQAWCLQVLGKPLGRRVVKNALLSYAFFQGWGNTPEQFEAKRSGAKLAIATELWSFSKGEDKNAAEEISRYLGLPQSEPDTGLPKMYLERDVSVLDRDREAINWNYTVKSSSHQVIVLDTRTWRGYPANGQPLAVPMLLCPSALHKQLREVLEQQDRKQLTFIVAPTNLFSLQGIDRIQHWHLKTDRVYDADVGDAWNINTSALAELLTTLFERRDRIIILSGDVHYSSAVRLDYWFSSDNSRRSHILVQLTASSLKNAEFMTQLIHTKIKSSLFRESRRYWLGWLHPHKMLEVKNLKKADLFSADWFCSLEWSKRQSSRQPNWGKSVSWLKTKPTRNKFVAWLLKLLKFLWQNRWLQEGKEVVGANNIGLIQLDRFEDNESASVIQDNYWYASWHKKQVVFSRFRVSLKLGIRD
jgi:hypothetical protein